jgi:hypothetical protein
MKNYFEPVHIKKYFIYDVFFNYLNQLVIICPNKRFLNIIYKNKKLNTIQCPHGHTTIFLCNNVNRENKIKLIINNEEIIVTPNNYPNFNGELIFSTMVKNEDNYIKQWIDYHHKNGIKRFIIYDNAGGNDGGKSYCSKEKNSNLKELLKNYLEKDIVILIKWVYPKRTYPPMSGSGQTSQQNHSIYAFRNSKFIGLFDIDEYVNIQRKQNINNFLNEYIITNKLNISRISSFMLLNKFFHNPNNEDDTGTKFFKIFNCDTVTRNGREKGFCIPKNVKTYSIHQVTMGKKMYLIPHNLIFFNHYCYLNKDKFIIQQRGNKKIKKLRKKIKTLYKDNTILKHI